MDNREIEERLKHMLKHCDPDGYCKYYSKGNGCDGCCKAVRTVLLMMNGETISDGAAWWRREAQDQAARAGELKIRIAKRLEEDRTKIAMLRVRVKGEKDVIRKTLTEYSIERLAEEESVLEELLYG